MMRAATSIIYNANVLLSVGVQIDEGEVDIPED